MNSRGILELALDLENGKRPCAEYGGGGDERCKYYSHGTLADEMARLSCTGSNSLAIFVLKLREFTSSRPCDRRLAKADSAKGEPRVLLASIGIATKGVRLCRIEPGTISPR
jgi:hypothetical protein